MQFRVLGPLQVHAGNGPLHLPGSRLQKILGVLLAHPNEMVPLEHLVYAVWNDEPPTTSRRQVQNSVSTLRRLVGDQADQPIVAANGASYQIRLGPGDLDSEVFQDRMVAAQRLAADGEATRAVTELRAALRLWRGPALAGLTGRVIEAAAAKLNEQRLAAVEECLDLELRLGRHRVLVGELTELVAEHPLRECLVGQLMLALHRSGRQADALQAYHRLRTRLADELALDPSSSLRELHTAILLSDAAVEPLPESPPTVAEAPAPPARRPAPGPLTQVSVVPAQLPRDVASFTGRADHLRQLDVLLADGADAPEVPIAVITGMAGVGKTALAVHWGHRVRGQFPGGQLYVDLRGYASAPPVRPIQALAQFLPELGVPAEQVPLDVSAAASLYRSLLADRRVLVVLDNAANPDQVRPLLPGSPGCLVLVTSRVRFSGLVAKEGARRVPVGPLTPDEACHLLTRVLGADQVQAEPLAAAALAQTCSHLPLALRVAAANLASRPWPRIGDYVAELRAGNRLAALDADDDAQAAVRGAFDLSYRAISVDAQRLFRLLALEPGTDVTAGAAAAAADITPGLAATLLDQLAAAHLLSEHLTGRYAYHDLLRRYAADRAHAEDPATERAAALRRLYDWYLCCADVAAETLYPQRLRLPVPPTGAIPPAGLADPGAALAWLDAERPNLVAVIRHAADHGPRPVAWLLADTLRGYFWLRGHAVDWMHAANAALAAANAEGDRRAQATALLGVADTDHRQNHYRRAVEHYTRAARLSRRIGWLDGQAAAFGHLGSVHCNLGRLDLATRHFTQAEALYRRSGSVYGEAVTIRCLGQTYHRLGRLPEAAAHYARALALHRANGSRAGEAVTLDNLGETLRVWGRLDEAMAHLTEALTLEREIGDRGTEVYTLHNLAAVHLDADRPGPALELARAAVAAACQTGDRRAEAASLTRLAAIHRRLDRPHDAAESHLRALDLTWTMAEPYIEAETLVGLAATYPLLGRLDLALGHARRALAIVRRMGFRMLEGRSLTVLADIRLALGQPDQAVDRARHALAIHRETGCHADAAEAEQILVRAGPACRSTEDEMMPVR